METYKENTKWRDKHFDPESDYMVKLSHVYRKSNLKKDYDFLLTKEAELIKKICEGTTAHHFVFAVYYYLLWNGFFSINRRFEFDRSKYSILEHSGLGVTTGKGVCLNIAAHFRDIIKHLTNDYYVFAVAVHLKESDYFNASNPEIHRNIADNKSISNSQSSSAHKKPSFNHANVLIGDKITGHDYIFDPTNFIMYNVVDTYENNQPLYRIDATISLDLDISVDQKGYKKVLDTIAKYNKHLARKKYIRYSDEALDKVLKTGILLCQKHIKDILEFRKKYDYLYDRIAQNMPDFDEMKNTVQKLIIK